MVLDGKVAIVTGGGGGIGYAVAQRLIADGARVVIADIDDRKGAAASRRLDASGASAVFVHTDVSDENSTRSLAQVAMETFSAIDILINNAALFATVRMREIENIPLAEWDSVMSINLRGPFLTARAVLPQMKRQRRGKIVNISSNTVFSGGPLLSHYVASKAGLIGFTRSLAREAGPFGICANLVAPGLTDTEAAQQTIPSQRFEAVTGLRAIGRKQEPADLVGAISFLCSPDSDFITGQTITVDGGQIFL
jgi:3-oxoacyl-[acyl-carrier protein] reductase